MDDAAIPKSTPTTPCKTRTPFPFSPSASQVSATSPARARSGYTWPLGDGSIGEPSLARYRTI